MPQLNPSPWLMILLFTWLIFITVIPPKVMAHKYPNEPNVLSTKTLETTSWNWQWH
uniref:ATP synthase complex subunit 8 n=1 Tax=Hippocampus abdominalis TaxID=109274 RepID=A0A0N7H500_HIPAB|nr:ATP synthase F0 subunit 8 [Hippocampus abdominalis]ALI16054.1 ATP synthase F0 subunit 8 [Hippocampus abdominalis]